MLGFLILGVVLLFTLYLAPLGIIILIAVLISRYQTEYSITNKRVHCRYGLIGRRTGETELKNVTDTSLSQGILGRLFNFGTVRINTAGSKGYEITFIGVTDPKYVISKFQALKENRDKNLAKDERIARMKDKLYTGEITDEQFEQAKRRILEESQ
jgi:uncharacterized membrane protein YdbT with pleckstrin-like domain